MEETVQLAFRHLESSLTKGNLWIYILKLLKEDPTYPLELRRRFDRNFGFRPATITFYVVIYKLEREGLLESFSSGGRRCYRCTPEGLEALEKAVKLLNQIASSLEVAGPQSLEREKTTL